MMQNLIRKAIAAAAARNAVAGGAGAAAAVPAAAEKTGGAAAAVHAAVPAARAAVPAAANLNTAAGAAGAAAAPAAFLVPGVQPIIVQKGQQEAGADAKSICDVAGLAAQQQADDAAAPSRLWLRPSRCRNSQA